MRSVRSQITVLLLIPLLSLTALWSYAAVVTGSDALAQRRYHTLDRKFAPGGQGVLIELGKERLASVTFLSASKAAVPSPPAQLRTQRTRVDAAVVFFRREALSKEARGAINPTAKQRLWEVFGELDKLASTRLSVDYRAMDRLQALTAYSQMVDAVHRLYDSLAVIDHSWLYNWTLSNLAAIRAMELISRESALVTGALVSHGQMSAAEHRMFVEMVGEQRRQWVRQRSLAPETSNTAMTSITASQTYLDFRQMEDRIADGARDRISVKATDWQQMAQPLVLAVNKAVLESAKRAGDHADDLGATAYLRLGLVGGVGLVAILLSVLLSLRFGRGLVRELVGLRRSAAHLADERLPAVVDRLRHGEHVDAAAEAPPLETGRTTEVVKVAQAFSTVQQTAVQAAVAQAELRRGVGQIFLNLARRNQSLLYRQLAMLDDLESRAEPDALEDLFRLDHLTTRMRRNAESLIILSGETPGHGWHRPVGVIDVLRGASAEVEDYTRVAVLTTSKDGLLGSTVTDVVHLLAELIENATSFSPPHTKVRITAQRVGGGIAVEIEDCGLGIKPDVTAEINHRLANPPEFDLGNTDRLGLFVVGRLAARHGIRVVLRPSPYGGTTAIVLLPHHLLVPAEQFDPTSQTSDQADRRDHPTQIPPPNDRHHPLPAAQAELPQRVRQQNLAPQLRAETRTQIPATGDTDTDTEATTRSPEQIRSLLASMQQGWQRGRNPVPHDPVPHDEKT